MKVTTIAPANIAFIKYWGRNDHKLFIPANNNISMSMSGCTTTTTIEISEKYSKDTVEVQFYGQESKILQNKTRKEQALYNQLDRIKKLANSKLNVKVKSINNFPSDAGIAASASSFAAFTGALLLAYGLDEKFNDKVELSKEIRLCGSGSAVRSAFGGFVEFKTGKNHDDSYATQIAAEAHWDLVDIVAVVNPEKKLYSSSFGHEAAEKSPYYKARITEMQPRIKNTRQAILDKDFKTLGSLIEKDSTSMHSVMMTSIPPIYYWGPGTMRIMLDLIRWRVEEDLHAYFTIDAGPNVHVICQKKDAKEVERRLKENKFVKWTIWNEPCEGVKQIDDHLF